jgi:hypothetical protein
VTYTRELAGNTRESTYGREERRRRGGGEGTRLDARREGVCDVCMADRKRKRKKKGDGETVLIRNRPDDPETRAVIVSHLEQGSGLQFACGQAGVGRSTVGGWLVRGRNAQELINDGGSIPEEEVVYLEFLWAVVQASSCAASAVMKRLYDASKEDWRACETWLRMAFPEIFTKPALEAAVKQEMLRQEKKRRLTADDIAGLTEEGGTTAGPDAP